ncbi:protein XRP2-like [Tachypleus tridentatus]|uniref:protein XRP2-like n=1 Tax=Tachypleus tridentatus TaxID=6853 RepID=UPI003FD1C3D3
MGCLQSKSRLANKEKENDTNKSYSWDNKKKLNPKDFTIENLKDETAGRLPNTVNGEQFIIQNCVNCNIYVFDHVSTVTVDDCINCNIFLGPSKGSVFLRGCEGSNFMIVCQQFRARDCKKLNLFLCCSTQPSIESCTGIKFGCFSYFYEELEEQFKKAGISIFNNNWNNVHDFTPVAEEQNWTFIPQDVKVEEFLPLPTTNEFSHIKISMEPSDSVVPKTLGIRSKISNQSCLVVFFSDGQAQKRALSFIKKLVLTNNVLVRTKEVQLENNDAERIFGSSSYNSIICRGHVIALEYNGDDSITTCQDTAKAITTETGLTGLIYVSTCPDAASQQIENFFNFADMHMSV